MEAPKVVPLLPLQTRKKIAEAQKKLRTLKMLQVHVENEIKRTESLIESWSSNKIQPNKNAAGKIAGECDGA